MFLKKVTRKSPSDLLIAVEGDVESEVDTGHSGNLAHVIVNGISLRDSPCCFGMADACRIMKFHDRVKAGQPGRNHLRSSAEAGKKVRFDETRRDFEITLYPRAVQ